MYSYWGNAIYNIASTIFDKASHIIYAAKCGTLKSAASIEKIVVPHLYALVGEPDESTQQTCDIVSNNCHSFVYQQKELEDKWKLLDEII